VDLGSEYSAHVIRPFICLGDEDCISPCEEGCKSDKELIVTSACNDNYGFPYFENMLYAPMYKYDVSTDYT
jgi:hypothetical protein